MNSTSARWPRALTAGRFVVSFVLVLLVVLPMAGCQSVAAGSRPAEVSSSAHGPGHDPVCEQVPLGALVAPCVRGAPQIEPAGGTIATRPADPPAAVPVVDAVSSAPPASGHRLLIALGVLRT